LCKGSGIRKRREGERETKKLALCPFFSREKERETASERLSFRGARPRDPFFFFSFPHLRSPSFSPDNPLLQVAADSKFVDLGADSLDTVEIMMALEVRRIYIYFSLGEKERERAKYFRGKKGRKTGGKNSLFPFPPPLSLPNSTHRRSSRSPSTRRAPRASPRSPTPPTSSSPSSARFFLPVSFLSPFDGIPSEKSFFSIGVRRVEGEETRENQGNQRQRRRRASVSSMGKASFF